MLAAIGFAATAVFLALQKPQPKTERPESKPKTASAGIPALVIGQPAAKLTIVAYGDFQCPRCNRFFTTVEPSIRQDYIDKGLVKFQWYNFASIGPESELAAQAAHCANDQNFFPQFYSAVFTYMNNNYWALGKNGENVGALRGPSLKRIAAQASDLINQKDFDKCLDGGKYAQAVREELTVAKDAGYGLNSYLVGKEMLTGVQPYSVFKPLIESQL